jgi:iron complex outermembrane receptor protein
MTKHFLLLTSALSAFTVSASAAIAAEADEASGGSAIGELVVVAEKREQNLQDVPVAISAFTAQQRENIGINTIQDITNFTPGLSYSTTLDRASIRGVGRLTNNLASEASVATYSDGFFTTSAVEAGKDTLFVDRVEVLRGPQGTLYGRNSIGGAINVISKRPTKDLYAEARVMVDNYAQQLYEGAFSAPFSDQLRFRVAGQYQYQPNGYFHNVAGGPSEGNVLNRYYVEWQAEADIGDHAQLWMKVATANWHNERTTPGGRGFYTAGHYDFNFTSPNSGLFFNPAFGYTVAHTQAGAATDNPTLNDVHDFNTNFKQNVDDEGILIFDLNFTYHFDGFDVKYVGGYDSYRYDLHTDYDTTDILSYTIPLNAGSTCSFVPGCQPLTVHPDLTFRYFEDNHWYSHEINITSTTDNPLQWILGGYFFDERYHEPEDIFAKSEPGVFSPTGLNAVGFTANPSGSIYHFDYTMRTRSVAGFGQVDWRLTDQWKATAGIRYTRDNKDGFEEFRAICFTAACIGDPRNFGNLVGAHALDITPLLAASYTSAAAAAVRGVVTPVTQTGPTTFINYTFDPATGYARRFVKDSYSATTGTLGLEWNPDSDTNLYVRYSRGYKAGGFNVGQITPSPGTKPEHINAYEIGLKRDFGRTLRTNIAAFYYDYLDLQVPVGVSNGSITQTQFFNVPKSRSDGIEFEGTWAPIGHLTFLLSYSYNDTKILSSCSAAAGDCLVDINDPLAQAPGAQPVVGGAQSVKGQRLPQAPKNKIAINGTYAFNFDAGSLILSASWVWRDKQWGTIFTRDYNMAPSWSQTDLRATWKGANDKYEIIGFVKNAFDQIGYTAASTGTRLTAPAATSTLLYTGTVATYGLIPPRTYGVELHYRFF